MTKGEKYAEKNTAVSAAESITLKLITPQVMPKITEMGQRDTSRGCSSWFARWRPCFNP